MLRGTEIVEQTTVVFVVVVVVVVVVFVVFVVVMFFVVIVFVLDASSDVAGAFPSAILRLPHLRTSALAALSRSWDARVCPWGIPGSNVPGK